ncbi:MEKHLA domain-containing protein [Streptomyces mirabilis]|uniref:MEKHLA domain-containing protein n=1 Tax=Streptomyces mirabilis TaxID=68239 RepID=UPI0033E32B6E
MRNDVISVALPLDTAFFSLLSGSYQRLLGRALAPGLPNGADAAGWLYHDAPFAVLAQDTADDPAFVYANTSAQRLFAYSWQEFVGLPSRLSAPVAGRGARDRLIGIPPWIPNPSGGGGVGLLRSRAGKADSPPGRIGVYRQRPAGDW